MVPMVILAGAALFYGYSNHYPIGKMIGIGLVGALAGIAVLGVEVAFADQPKVPCWSEMHGGAQFFRGMPYLCQAAVIP
jgi:disulfide bond formation protein DsbB